MPKTHALNKCAFTLAELLVTLAAVGILLAATLPATQGMLGRGKLDAAADAVHAAVQRARQHALASKQPTYLLLAPRAYALYTINTHTPPVTTADGQFIDDWKPLPEGIVFDPAINTGHNAFDPATGSWQGALTRNNTLLIEGEEYATIGFKPNGLAASATRHLHLAHGIVDSSGARAFPQSPGKQIHTTTFGKSVILDYATEADGAIHVLGGAR